MDDGFYPVEEKLGADFTEGNVLLVDVGGGLGHDIEELKEKCLGLVQRGRLVLQDLEATVKAARRARPWIDAMVHNFFTPQPVKGRYPRLQISSHRCGY